MHQLQFKIELPERLGAGAKDRYEGVENYISMIIMK